MAVAGTARVLADALAAHDVVTDTIRVVDHEMRPGVQGDEGLGDGWPEILQADPYPGVG